MNWMDLWRALALVLVIEGLLPFAAPMRSRDTYWRLSQLSDRGLRLIGLGSMIVGIATLQLLRFLVVG